MAWPARAVVVEGDGIGNGGPRVVDAAAGLVVFAVAVTTLAPAATPTLATALGYELVVAGAVMMPRLRPALSRARVLLMAALGAGLSVADVIELVGLSPEGRSAATRDQARANSGLSIRWRCSTSASAIGKVAAASIPARCSRFRTASADDLRVRRPDPSRRTRGG